MPELQAAPKQQQPQTAQLSKLKKIEWFAGHLVNEAASKEKAGRIGDAIVDYLQAADLLLLLAKGQQEYTPWKSFSDSVPAEGEGADNQEEAERRCGRPPDERLAPDERPSFHG